MSDNLNAPNSDETAFLALWAARYGAALQLEGTCGFGRECVGITHGSSYPDWQDTDGMMKHWDSGDHEAQCKGAGACQWVSPWEVEAAAPPAGLEDAYHKHPCLAVLGRGRNAVHQLYLWVKHLDDSGVGIVALDRQPTDAVSAMLHGFAQPVLTTVPPEAGQ